MHVLSTSRSCNVRNYSKPFQDVPRNPRLWSSKESSKTQPAPFTSTWSWCYFGSLVCLGYWLRPGSENESSHMELSTCVTYYAPALLHDLLFWITSDIIRFKNIQNHPVATDSDRVLLLIPKKSEVSVKEQHICRIWVDPGIWRRETKHPLFKKGYWVLVVPCCANKSRHVKILRKQVFRPFLGQKASHRVLHVLLFLGCWFALYDSHACCYQSFKDENRAIPSFRKTSQRSWRLGFWCRSCKRKSQRMQPHDISWRFFAADVLVA
jgi:hypothetical protein